MSQVACAFTGIKGERIALKDVSISAVLRDLLADVSVSQTYRNEEQTNIEAVYTFPLPLDALLLEFVLVIGNRRLKGSVVEKKAAEKKYEAAIEAGDAAVMLEQLEPGVYTMNVGNLLPGESMTVTFRYSMLYRWTGDRLRMMLPTTIATRYGASPHLPHQAPETSLFAENRFSISIEVFGVLQNAQFQSPLHALEMSRSDDKTTLVLNQDRAAMDRDFVLNIKAEQAQRNFLLTGKDGNGLAALASFQPFFPGLRQNRLLNLALVIDCSGSMQGDSIAQARQALEKIMESLGPADRFTIIRFGSTTDVLWDRLAACTPDHRAAGIRFAQNIQANMGGTEIGNALSLAYGVLAAEETSDILLVTDGEVSSWQPVVEQARRSGHRIFTVGVGNAVSEAFVRGLASQTGGACELVSPREEMAERIIRHFERIRSPRAKHVKISWPGNAAEQYPSTFRAIFDGDTVVGFARFAEETAAGPVVLEAELDTGERVREELAASAASRVDSADDIAVVARLVAHAHLKEAAAEDGVQIALRYRLLSPWTNWIATVERPETEKVFEIPAIRKVPQTLAAGSVIHSGFTGRLMPAPPAPASAGPARGASFTRGLENLDVFASMSRVHDDPGDFLMDFKRDDLAAMTEFLALVPMEEWTEIAKWASQKGDTVLELEASDFRELLRSHRVADLTRAQIRQGVEIVKQAVRMGYRLNRSILKEARRRRILTS
jgi:Ca-activated chloride channel family protein